MWFLTFARVFSMKDVEETQENMEKNKESMSPDQIKHCMETVLYINSLAQYV